jgi:stage II sporulation protein Q
MKKLIKKIMTWSQEARVGIVMAAVALLLIGGVSAFRSWWAPSSSSTQLPISSSSKTPISSSSSSSPQPVVLPVDEIVEKPFSVEATMARGYYEQDASLQERMDAMVFYDGTYKCSQGLDFVFNNQEFDVLAASSGIVKDKVVDSIYGLTVTIECASEVEIVYASLKSSSLQVGDEVNKGDLIGVAGESIYGSELDAPMLHFRMYKNDQIVNPKNNFGNALKNVQ